MRWLLVGLIGLFVTTIAVLSLPQRANAAVRETLSNSIVKKALASGLRRCYETGAISPRVDKLSTFNSFEDLIIGGTDENYVALPNGLTNVSDSAVSCKQLFMGYTLGGGSFEGLFSLAGRKASGFVTNEEKIALLRGMGYESATSGTNKQCVNYIYNYTYLGVPGETATKNICVTDGKITIEESQSINCGGNDASLACRVPLVFEVSGNKVTIHDHDFGGTSEPVGYNNNWDDFVKEIERQLSTKFSSFDDGTVFYTFNRSNPLSDGGHGDDSYVMKASAVNNASQYLSLGLATQFSNNEKVTYYVSAIKNWFFDGVNLEGGTGTNSYWTCGIKDWNAYGSYTKINANMNGTSGCNCGIDIAKARTTSNIYGFSGDSFDASGSTTLDLSSTIIAIDSLVEASPSDTCEPSKDDSAAPIDNTEETSETSNNNTDDVCYGSEGTLGL
ncbi:MAG: hypothetical protein Q4A25_01830, partial [Candidatus Saccharibacteria bacterium]|nr:hypothetical protein [Candidatus Saccharibacteria bacterium]